jgi:hypothetical protein
MDKELVRKVVRRVVRNDVVIEPIFNREDRTETISVYFKGVKVLEASSRLEVVALLDNFETLQEMYDAAVESGIEVDQDVQDWYEAYVESPVQ